MTDRRAFGTGAALLLCVAGPANAQLAACMLPERLPTPRSDAQKNAAQRRIVPVDSYLLTLSWSPQHCAGARSRDAFQCEASANRFGFILHGLWPQGRNGDWPQYCRAARPLSPAVLRSNLCATPSVDLLQHEWAKHGTCVDQSPERYFDKARSLYGRIRFPDMARLSARDDLTVQSFSAAFIAANQRSVPALRTSFLHVRLTRDGWLDEVWLCLDRQSRFTACKSGQGSGAAPNRRMTIRSPGKSITRR